MRGLEFALLLILSSLLAVSHAYATSSSFSKLSVSELKRLLTERGIDIRDCLEKSELVQRLESSHVQPHKKPSRSGFTTHETNTINVFKKAAPSVVYITTASKSRRPLSLNEQMVPTGAGSGIVWDEQGHIVTNAHVVLSSGKLPKSVKVKLHGRPTPVDATVVGVERDKDLAVLKIPKSTLQPLQIGVSSSLQVGQSVLAIGNPFGLDTTLTVGVVSALGRELMGFGQRKLKNCIQTDCAINPGNSGGPLIDSSGKLIGVNTMIYSPNGSGSVGIGFAIPVDTVRRVVNQIIRYGKVMRPTLGIVLVEDRIVKNIEIQTGKSLNGVLVAEVVPGSPASQVDISGCTMYGDGSLVLGDLITHVDGAPMQNVEDLLCAIEEKSDGALVTLRIARGCDPRRVETVQTKLVNRDRLSSGANLSVNGRGTGTRTANFWQ